MTTDPLTADELRRIEEEGRCDQCKHLEVFHNEDTDYGRTCWYAEECDCRD